MGIFEYLGYAHVAGNKKAIRRWHIAQPGHRHTGVHTSHLVEHVLVEQSQQLVSLRVPVHYTLRPDPVFLVGSIISP